MNVLGGGDVHFADYLIALFGFALGFDFAFVLVLLPVVCMVKTLAALALTNGLETHNRASRWPMTRFT